MGPLLYSHFRVTNVKLINEKNWLPHSITFFVFSLLCCKYICDICLNMLLMQVQQHIYLEDYRRHSVAVSQRKNDHVQIYIIIMKFFKWLHRMNVQGVLANKTDNRTVSYKHRTGGILVPILMSVRLFHTRQ